MHKKKLIIALALLFFLLFGRLFFEAIKLTPVFLQLLMKHEISLKQTDNRINMLLLGVGGSAHEGPNLTDTIIFTSINLNENTVTLVSVPRDLWVPELSAKINVAYPNGEEKKKGDGLILTKAIVSKVLGQNIDYGVRIDFDGFVKAVDLLGGLDISVERTFDDYIYPIAGKENDLCGHTSSELSFLATISAELDAFPCRYEHIHFDKGIKHMDGEAVLKFVRSRHGEGEEGTDFARSQRQEKVIKAFKDKAFSLAIFTNPAKILGLYDVLRGSIDTDITQDEFDDFIRLAEKLRDAKIQNVVLDYGDEKTQRKGLLVHPAVSEKYKNQWILTPRIGEENFSEIQSYITCQLTSENCKVP